MQQTLSILALGTLVAVAALDSNKIDVKTTKNEYCDICEDHTLCKFKGLGESCEASTDGGVTEIEKKYILNTHNDYRRRIAKGLEARGINGSQPGASNMMKLEWDEELAKIAQHWADQCTFQHDTCRHDRRFKVGQNIYWNWRFPILKNVNWTAAMASWYDEVDKFDPQIASSYEFDSATGHYTQLVWHDSTLIGCGRRSYGPNKIYVCNYGPTGNWLTEPLYKFGTPCSSCPTGTQCQDGLCAMQSKNQDTYIPVEDGAVSLPEEINMLSSSQTSNLTGVDPEEEEPSPTETSNQTSSQSVKQAETDSNQQVAVSESKPVPETSLDQISDLPFIHLNLINGLTIPDNDEIRNEIEDVKRRIRDLLDKIVRMNAGNPQ